MNLLDFYKIACLTAKHRGFDIPAQINVYAFINGGDLYYEVNIYINGERIKGKQQKNPVAAIRAFKNALNFHKHQYNKQYEYIELI
jgi:hypothetical protein